MFQELTLLIIVNKLKICLFNDVAFVFSVKKNIEKI